MISKKIEEIKKLYDEASVEDKIKIRNKVYDLSNFLGKQVKENLYQCGCCYKFFYIGEAEEKFETWNTYGLSISTEPDKTKTKQGYRYYCPLCNGLLPDHYRKTLIFKEHKVWI